MARLAIVINGKCLNTIVGAPEDWPLAVVLGNGIEMSPGDLWDGMSVTPGDPVWPDGTVMYIPPRGITEIDLKRALTAAERAGIRTAVKNDEEVADWMDYVQAAMRSGHPLSVTDPDLRAGFLRLKNLGVFTGARLKEIQDGLLAG